MKNKRYIRIAVIVLIWLAIWQILAVVINNSILLSGPVETVMALISLCSDPSFFMSVGATIGKVLLGFLTGLVLGTGLAVLSYRSGLIKDFLSPFVSVIKSIPIVSFIIIALIWAGSSNVTLIVSSVISFTTLAALPNTAYVVSALVARIALGRQIDKWGPMKSLAIGMAFRGGITAEVVGQPLRSIGNGLYRAKINLATSEMLAWTLVAVLAAFLIERLISFIVKKVLK